MFFAIVYFILSPANAETEVINSPPPEMVYPQESVWKSKGGHFPFIYFNEFINAAVKEEDAHPYWAHTEKEAEELARLVTDNTSLLLNNDILAYYGHPNSRNMGILGRYSIEELDKRLKSTAEKYKELSGGRDIIRAFYLIYGTAWPGGDIGYIGDATLQRYIEYALKNDMLVFIDNQIGRFDPINAIRRMLPWLKYPNVHLALDPEWRTDKPMQEIGHLTAEEINRAQRAMEEYIIANDIPGERMLVIHQFNWVMIRNRENVRSDFRRVRLVHCISGIGTPAMKRDTYAFGARATNMPVKGFKLWYDFGISGHTDRPLMSPRDVYNLNPRPYIIMYQ